MRLIYVGNFGPPHSTENHVARAFENEGHSVVRVQENDPTAWVRLAAFGGWKRFDEAADLILWTRTGWDWPAAGASTDAAHSWQFAMLASRGRPPVVGFHLDRWWGLARQGQVLYEPFFRADLVITADGAHDDQFAKAGVNHAWLPPAVSADECELGTVREGMWSPVAFVGSWSSYHPEWKHRSELVARLSRRRDQVAFWPRKGEPAVRGEELRDLYASVDVLVGDSCLVPKVDGSPMTHYCSDRIPETLGRGGFLIHPAVHGITDGPWVAGEHLATWTLGDWKGLDDVITHYLRNPDERAAIAEAGRAHTLAHHTYERRVNQILTLARLNSERGPR